MTASLSAPVMERSVGDRPGARMPATDDPDGVRLQAIYDAHGTSLFRYLLRLTRGERQTAEDLLQETLLRAWNHRDVLTADIENLRPWLFTVARRIAIDAARAKHARPAEVGVDISLLPCTDDPIERMVSASTVRQAVAQLRPAHRAVLVELYFKGGSTLEVAQRLGVPEGTVKSRTFYALRALRAALNSGAPE